MAKEGSTVSGLMDSFATAISLALQHGVPLKVLAEKFAHTRFEPSGWTGNEQIGYAKSIMDYLFRWMQIRFLNGHQLDLFHTLAPNQNLPSIPVSGTVGGARGTVNMDNRVVPNLAAAQQQQHAQTTAPQEKGSAAPATPSLLEGSGFEDLENPVDPFNNAPRQRPRAAHRPLRPAGRHSPPTWPPAPASTPQARSRQKTAESTGSPVPPALGLSTTPPTP